MEKVDEMQDQVGNFGRDWNQRYNQVKKFKIKNSSGDEECLQLALC